jgi:hypothetical protein
MEDERVRCSLLCALSQEGADLRPPTARDALVVVTGRGRSRGSQAACAVRGCRFLRGRVLKRSLTLGDVSL